MSNFNKAMHKGRPYIVEIDGVQVFSADFVFEQTQAQSCRIEMARGIAIAAVIMAAGAVVIALAAILWS